MIKKIPEFSINEIPRESNEKADKLATGAIKLHKAKKQKRKKTTQKKFKEIIE